MSCKIEFKPGTFELTEKTKQCISNEIEIWEANKLLREIGILPLNKLNELSQNSLLNILNEELVLESLYPTKSGVEKHTLSAIIKKENIAQKALLNFANKIEEYLNVLNKRTSC